MKDGDPPLNPHWQLTSYPFRFLPVIMRHFLKLIKGKNTLMYMAYSTFLFHSSWIFLPFPFFHVSLLLFSFCLYPYKLAVSVAKRTETSHTWKIRCFPFKNPLQRSPHINKWLFSTSTPNSSQMYFTHCYIRSAAWSHEVVWKPILQMGGSQWFIN